MVVIGLVVFFLFIISVFAESSWTWRDNNDLEPYYLGLFAAATMIIAASFFQPYLETNLMGIWFWLLLGLLRTSAQIKQPK
jgi:hypothetical protein